MSDSVRPHRWQPNRLPCPWDSPGKNTGVGCHFLLQCMKVQIESEVAQSCPTLSDPMDCSLPGSPVHGILYARDWSGVPFCASTWNLPSLAIWSAPLLLWDHSVMSDSSLPHGLQPTRLLRPWDFPGKSTGVGCHCLLQNIRLDSIKLLGENIPQSL